MNAKKLFSCLVVAFVATFTLLMVGCTSESPKLQRVAIVELSNITTNSLECHVKIDPNGSSAIVERGILFDTRDWKGEKVIKFDGEENTFTMKLDNLLPGAFYGIRAYARTEEGVIYSTVSTAITSVSYGTVKDVDGNEYKTIKIGTQEWMLENLRTKRFNDETTIKESTSAAQWIGNVSNLGAFTKYEGKTDEDVKTYGYLYNGFAARMTAADGTHLLAPKGWKVPSKEDWDIFQEFLIIHGYGTADDDNAVGVGLASNSLWDPSETPGTIGFDLTANNKTQFNAIPAGYRVKSGTSRAPFQGDKLSTYFWSSTTVPNPIGTTEILMYFAALTNDDGKLILDSPKFNAKNLGAALRTNGHSVRCMRNTK